LLKKVNLLTPIKSSEAVQQGSQTVSSPLAFAEGLFIFIKLFSRKRRIFNIKG
jgi:hypothetical protein